MQIKFKPYGSAVEIQLAGAWTEETSDLSGDVSDTVQRLDYWHGAEPDWASRGNKVSSRSWSSHRTFASIVECELFLLEHGVNEGGSDVTNLAGTFEFTMSDYSTSAVRYARGTMRINFSEVIGVSLRVSYQIEYGLIRTARPADPEA